MSSFKTVIKNFTSLGLVQIVNYLVPIIVIPILLQKVGMVHYGTISLTMGIVNVFVAFSDYGLTITSVRQISADPENLNLHRKVFFQNLIVKSLLLIVLFFGLFTLTLIIATWNESQYIILLAFTIVISNALLPTWYFQGIQKNLYSATFNLISQSLYIMCLLYIVSDAEQFVYVPFLKGLCLFLAIIPANFVVLSKIGFVPPKISKGEILKYIKGNFSVFISVSTNSLYRNAPIILAGFFLAAQPLGLYGIIDKFIWVMLGAFVVVFNSIYPTFCNLCQTSMKTSTKFLLESMVRLGVLVIPAIAITYFVGADIIALVSEEVNSDELRPLIQLLAIVPLLIFANIPISIIIIGRNHKRMYFIYHCIQLLMLTVSCLILLPLYSIQGLIISLIIAESSSFLIGAGFILRHYYLTPKRPLHTA